MYRNFTKLFFIGNVLLCSACTQPGEKTAVGAATGGVIGAGLGAIVGSQTGSAGAGLAIGAAAGAGAGAAVGNSLEAQEQNLKSQDEALERQEQRIRAQQSEITELRRMGGDSVGAHSPFDNNSAAELQARKSGIALAPRNSAPAINSAAINPPTLSASSFAYTNSRPPVVERPIAAELPKADSFAANSNNRVEPIANSGIVETDLSPSGMEPLNNDSATSAGEVKGALNWDKPDNADSTNSAASVNGNSSSECRSAQVEMTQATQASEAADKLFHIRRALRLCPDNASYHASLADLYRTLNRPDDATFEYKEALKIEPENAAAKKGIELVGK